MTDASAPPGRPGREPPPAAAPSGTPAEGKAGFLGSIGRHLQRARRERPAGRERGLVSGRSAERGRGEGQADAGLFEIRAGLVAIGVFFIGFGLWAGFVRLDAAVTASGVIVVSGNRQTVQHRDGGIVSGLHVAEGDRVERGAVLIELASNELLAQERALMSRLIEMEAMRARLLAELEGAERIPPPALFEGLEGPFSAMAARALARHEREWGARRQSSQAQLGVLAERRQQLEARIMGYENQIGALDRQSALIEEELEGVRRLAERGLTPLTRVRALERGKAEIEGRRSELSALIQQAREAIGETRMQGLAVTDGRSEETAGLLREADARIGEITPELDAVRTALERMRIRAPASGEVVGLRVFTVGGVVRAGEPLMDIVPEAQPLVIEAQISPTAADDVAPGMAAQIRFVSAAGASLPLLEGRVLRISADRFVDERSGGSYFLAEVEAPEAELARLGATLAGPELLKPGLPVEIVVPLRARTALDYLLEPLNRQLWRSFREY